MPKGLSIAAVLAAGLLLAASSLEALEQPFKWSCSFADGALSVEASVPEGSYIYEAETKVEALAGGRELKASATPAKTTHEDKLMGSSEVFAGGKVHKWVFDAKALAYPLEVKASWQGCREGREGRAPLCYMPGSQEWSFTAPGVEGKAPAPKLEEPQGSQDGKDLLAGFKVARTASGYMGVAEFKAFLKGGGPELPAGGALADRGFLAAALLALLGGLLLNLTPCVLPMIPVNLAIIGAGGEEKDRLKAAARGLVYGAGIALAYGALGLLSALGGATFGQLNSEWWFNAGAGALFAVLALAMFELFDIDLSRYGSGLKMPSSARLAGIFLLGTLSAVLAGACVAPVVIAVLLHSAGLYAEGHAYGLALPFVLGLGMALPWPVAAAGISMLPKPGAWMRRVKQALGVLIALLAAYYLWTGASLFMASQKPGGDGLEASFAALDAALAKSKEDGRPLMVDFWASWCKNCEAIEATTFKSHEIVSALEAFHVVKFQAENPDGPKLKPLLGKLGVAGLPSYLVLEPLREGSRKP